MKTEGVLVIVCGFEIEPACCEFGAEDFITEAEFMLGAADREGDGFWCDETHRPLAAVICGRPEHPPMVPGWTHERWTGHAFEPMSRQIGVIV